MENALIQRRKAVSNALMDFAQGASNSAASAVSAPVDGIAWLLRKAGVPIPQAPVGGSDWMAQRGLTRSTNGSTAGYIGEAVGGVAPMVAAAKAPHVANALLKAGDNLANAQRIPMSSQRGAIYVGKQKIADNAYHGTRSGDFNRVDFDEAAQNRKNFNMGDAFWLTDSKRQAASYAAPSGGKGGLVKEANVFLKNPMQLDAFAEATRVANEIGANPPKSWPEAAKILQYADWAKDNLSDAISKGHDGLIIRNVGDAPIPHAALPLEEQLGTHVAVIKPNRVRFKNEFR